MRTWLAGVAGTLLGAGVSVLGVVLVGRAETVAGAVGWSLILACGLATALSWVLITIGALRPSARPATRQGELDGETALVVPRRFVPAAVGGLVIFSLLGGWAGAMALVAAVQQRWVWALVLTVPAIWLLGFPVRAALGPGRPGAVWLTPTRLVSRSAGHRVELALRDVQLVSPVGERVLVHPRPGAAMLVVPGTPGWSGRARADVLEIPTAGLALGPDDLARTVREAVGQG